MLSYPTFEPHFAKEQWTVPAVLEHQANRIGDRPFLQWTHENAPLTFREVNARVNRLAHGMSRLGIGKDDRIVLFLPNCLDFVLVWFAANKVGAVEAPINSAYMGSFLEHQVNLCQAETIVVAEDLLSRVVESLPRMPALKRIVVWSPHAGGDAGLPELDGLAVMRLEDLDSGDESDPPNVVTSRDLAAILFTSGTTGPSKGVLIPHAQLYFFSEQDVQLVRLTGQDTYVSGFPLFHGNAQFLTVYPSLIAGARCVLYERFSASQWLDRLIMTGATVTNSLGVTLPFVLNQPPTERDKDHQLRRIWAAPTPYELIEPFRERFGPIDFVEGFGQTEICLPFLTPYGMDRPPGSCGVVVDEWFDVRLVDPDTDEEVAIGEIGELLVRPKEPWILNQGYVNMPEKTVEAYRNLWFHTGDGMRRDADGWYFFADRMKDTLRRRGENISSYEVETPIREHPAVVDVAVVGVKAEFEGGEEEVKACIVLKQGVAVTPEEIVAWCEARMPYFVVPRYIEFLDSLPKTPSEKIQKSVLREAGLGEEVWDRQVAKNSLKE